MIRYIIDTSAELALPLEAHHISFSGQNTDDKIHDFIIQNFNISEQICLIIPVQLGDEASLGLKIAMHIRCTQELEDSVRLCPIILLYEGNTDELLQLDFAQTDHFFSLITQTKGVYLLSPYDAIGILDSCTGTDVETLKKEMKNIPFFKAISDHNHSIANVWGAQVFQSFSKSKTATNSTSFKNLYFKYLVLVHDLHMPKLEKVPACDLKSDTRFLLIDDHDVEWLPALQSLVGSNNIKSIRYDEKYQKYKHNILNIVQRDEFDIILLDLRLDKEEENVQKMPTAYSGYKILKSIKLINKGTQVIIMTASNKAWNMKALMDIGADGYYVKEGPEYYDKISAAQSYVALIDTLKECGGKVYLRKVYLDFKTLRTNVKSTLIKHAPDHDSLDELMTFESSCISKMDLVMDLLSKNKSNDGSKYYRFAYLLLYQLLEEYTSLSFIYQKAEDKKKQSKVICLDGKLVDVFGPDPTLSGNVKCNFTLTNSGKYDYQTKESKSHYRNVIFSADTFKVDQNAKSQTKETSLFKMISVFKERHNFNEFQCADLIEMTYLRSNLCGHETGNIDVRVRDIGKDDVVKILDLVMVMVQGVK